VSVYEVVCIRSIDVWIDWLLTESTHMGHHIGFPYVIVTTSVAVTSVR
jgi:hypothetical protein